MVQAGDSLPIRIYLNRGSWSSTNSKMMKGDRVALLLYLVYYSTSDELVYVWYSLAFHACQGYVQDHRQAALSLLLLPDDWSSLH